MLNLELWYRDQNLRSLCEVALELLPGLGLELVCPPADRVDMGMVAEWDLATLEGNRIYLGLTEGDYNHGVVSLFSDDEGDPMAPALERVLERAWNLATEPRPGESILIRGLGDVAGPLLSTEPITSRVLRRIREGVRAPGENDFAPQLRVLGPRAVNAIGAGALSTLVVTQVTSQALVSGALWLDFSWSLLRPEWTAP